MDKEFTKAIIYLLAGVAILLLGMRLMSSGLKKQVGKSVKMFFKKTQNNPFVSMGLGTVVTAGIQSSDATNAMVVGFINAKAMTIYQGLSIMLGAYIGTTVTGIIASFSSLSISTYFLLLSFIGAMMLFFKKEKMQNIGEIVCGLGILFFGLSIMKDSFKNPTIIDTCQNIFSSINFGPLLFLIGGIITAVVQSSSAVTSIVIAMVGGGALGFSSGLYLALGATLGTVATTLLTSLGGNINGKKAAIIIFVLRTISSIAMLIILMIFESDLTALLHRFAINGSNELPIAMFTVFYNIIFMPLLILLLKPSIKVADKLIVEKENNSLASVVKYIDDKQLVTPRVATMQVQKEIISMFDMSFKNLTNSMNLIINDDATNDKQIVSLEDGIDYLNKRITNFLISLSSKVTERDEKIIGSYFHVVNDIERIGDHAYNFYEMYYEMEEKELKFSEVAKAEIKEFYDTLYKMFKCAENIFETKAKEHIYELNELEDITDTMKNKFYTNHYNRIKENQSENELSPFYSSLMTELERIGDHLNNIGYSIINPTGD